MREFGQRPEQDKDKDKSGEQGSSLTRREFLNIAAGTGAALAGSKIIELVTKKMVDRKSDSGEEELEDGTVEIGELPEWRAVPKPLHTGKLAGRKFSNLYTSYTSIEGRVPEVAEIDFIDQMEKLWKRKEKRSGHNRVVVNTSRDVRKRYRYDKHDCPNLPGYVKEVGLVLDDLKHKFDWQRYSEIKKLKPEELRVLKKVCSAVNAQDLLAYSLTELMPSADGKLNVNVLEFLLKNAGREYIESIPAIYDAKTSFGPYQFTEFALFDHKGQKRGSSIPNQALPGKDRIPGSVSKLRGKDHYKAGYLFMVDNMANFVHKIGWSELGILENQFKENKDDVIAFLATAHHGPGWANKYATNWLKDKAKKHYQDYCTSDAYKQYANKTKANLKAIREIK